MFIYLSSAPKPLPRNKTLPWGESFFLRRVFPPFWWLLFVLLPSCLLLILFVIFGSYTKTHQSCRRARRAGHRHYLGRRRLQRWFPRPLPARRRPGGMLPRWQPARRHRHPAQGRDYPGRTLPARAVNPALLPATPQLGRAVAWEYIYIHDSRYPVCK